MLVALGIGALLGSGALVGLAERQPLGTQRDIALGAANVTDRLAHGLSLNRPAERLAAELESSEEVYDVEALIARARASAPAATEDPPPAVIEEPPEEVPVPPVDDDGGAVEDAGATEAESETGPPLDGAITPIEGVDCVVTGAEPAPTTTGDGSEEPTEADQPGGATPDRDGVDGTGEPDAGDPATDEPDENDPATDEPDENDPAPEGPEDPDENDPAPEGPEDPDEADPATDESDEGDPATDDPASEEPGDEVDLPECPPGFVPASGDAEPPADTAEPGEGEPDAEPESFEPVTFEAPRTPGGERPLVMYVGGDSISRDLGEGLARVTPADVVRVDLDPRPATGLSRPDFFDWAQHLAGVLTESLPDVIVVLFGANDFQNVEHEGEILDRFGDEWLDLYRERVDRIMTLLSQPEVQTIWVGQPPVREPRLSGGLERLNTVYAEVAAQHPQITYVDTWALFSDDEGGYVDEIDGVRLRREDGVHLTIDGGNRLAETVWDAIGPSWGLG